MYTYYVDFIMQTTVPGAMAPGTVVSYEISEITVPGTGGTGGTVQ